MPAGAAARTTAELRRFGLTVGGALLLLALVSWWRGHTLPPLLMGGLGSGLVLPALLAPRLLAAVERAWMRFADVVGRINTRIVLTIVYALVLTPIGLVRRAFGDPLDRRTRDGRASTWVRRPRAPVDPARYRQQF